MKAPLFKRLTKLTCFMFCCMFLLSSNLQAQQENAEKVITITIKTVDSDGNAEMKVIALTGEDAEIDDIDSIVQEHLTGDETTVEVDVDVQMLSGAEEGDEIEITIESESSNENIEIEEENIFIFKDEDGNMERIEVEDMVIEMDGDKVIINGEEMKNDVHTEIIESENGEVRIMKKSFGENHSRRMNRAFLGIHMENAENVEGVKVTKIVEGSAAEEAGIKINDIILKLNGIPVKTTTLLREVISSINPGETAKVTLLRDNQEQTIAANLKAKPLPNKRYAPPGMSKEHAFMRGYNAMSPKDCNPANCDPFNCKPANCDPYACDPRSCPPSMCIEEGTGKPLMGVTVEDTDNTGTKIIEIQSETSAKRAGLLIDDVITRIEKEDIKDADDLVDVISTYEPGDKVKVHYLRNGKKGKVKVELGEKMMYRRKVACCAPDGNRMEKKIIIKKKKGTASEDTTTPSFETPNINNTLELDDISLFPNPSNGNITVQFSTTEKAATTISVLDVSGKEVFKDVVQNFDGIYNRKIDLSSNAEGIYFLNIQQGDKVYTEQIVLNK